MSKTRCSKFIVLLAVIVVLCGLTTSVWAATTATTSTSTWEWLGPLISALVAGGLGVLAQSPFAGKISDKLSKWIPGLRFADAVKAEQILTTSKGQSDFIKWLRSYTLILLVGLIALSLVTPQRTCADTTVTTTINATANTNLMSGALTPTYVISSDGSQCLGGKASIDFSSKALKNGTCMVGSFDIVGVGSTMVVGPGISYSLMNGAMRLGVGACYLSGARGLSINVTAVAFQKSF